MILTLTILSLLLSTCSGFGTTPKGLFLPSFPLFVAPSKVVDPDGPTPAFPEDEPTVIDPQDLEELKYDPDAHPIPHQPWRRGTTEGCEDPIDAPWRVQAESLVHKAAEMVGGKVVGVTWYLTQVVITVDDDSLQHVEDYTTGPEIILAPDDNGPEYFDPQDPNPEPIWADEEEYLYERHDDDTIPTIGKDEDAPENPVSLYVDKETREDMAAMSEEEEAQLGQEETPVDSDVFELDTMALSTMAGAILKALETMEDELHVLERHEVILTSPGDANLLETQREYDDNEGQPVVVETQDPWGSNRVLKGTLLTRNSMDVVINKRGRMVTIPHSFVRAVRLVKGSDVGEYEEEEEEE